MDGLPPVSCMCLTYGRPSLLEEALQSFLLQDYEGPKELVILNDCAEQALVFDHAEVHVVNVSRRFRTVGEKRNACAALTSHDLLFVWDDDDVYLPHRLSYSVRMLNPEKRFFKPSKALTLNNGQIGGPTANLFHSGACFTKSLFDEADGYRHMGSGQDLDLELRFEKIIGRGKNYNQIRPAEIYYLYRWGGSGSYHLSAFGRDANDKEPGQARVGRYVASQFETGQLSRGEVVLQPAWRMDYGAAVHDYLSQKASVPSE